MKFKKTFIFMCLIICFLSMASICAGDVDDAAIISDDTGQIDPLQSDAIAYDDNIETSDENDNDENEETILRVPSGSGSTIYVNASAASGGDGSEAKPFKNLKTALNAASEGDTIMVATGTYTGSNNRDMVIKTNNLNII